MQQTTARENPRRRQRRECGLFRTSSTAVVVSVARRRRRCDRQYKAKKTQLMFEIKLKKKKNAPPRTGSPPTKTNKIHFTRIRNKKNRRPSQTKPRNVTFEAAAILFGTSSIDRFTYNSGSRPGTLLPCLLSPSCFRQSRFPYNRCPPQPSRGRDAITEAWRFLLS